MIAKWMKEKAGWVVKSSHILQLHFKSDVQVYEEAKKQGNVIIITKDSDLEEIINRLALHLN